MLSSALGLVLLVSLQAPSSTTTATTTPPTTPSTTSSTPAATSTEAPKLALPAKTAPRLFVVDVADKGAGGEVAAAINQAVQDQAVKSHAGETITATQIRILLTAQAQQQLVGCDSELCMTDVGRVIEADRIVGGNVVRVGDDVLVTLIAVNPVDGKRVAQQQRKVPLNRDLYYYAARQLTSLLLTGKAADPRVPVVVSAVDPSGGAAEVAVIVDGKQVATAATHQIDLEPGQHELILKRDGFVDWKSVVDVVEATPLQVSAKLVAARTSLWPAAIATGVVAVALTTTSLLLADYAVDRYAGTGLLPWSGKDAAGKPVEYVAANSYLNVVPTNSADLCQREIEISLYTGRAAADGEPPNHQNACGVAAGPGLVHYLGGTAALFGVATGALVTADLVFGASAE
jgi:hypothetical protein